MLKEHRELMKYLQDNGVGVAGMEVRGRRGHLQVVLDTGARVTLPNRCTDWRTKKNVLRDARRAGDLQRKG
jgi:hypothetical protein